MSGKGGNWFHKHVHTAVDNCVASDVLFISLCLLTDLLFFLVMRLLTELKMVPVITVELKSFAALRFLAGITAGV